MTIRFFLKSSRTNQPVPLWVRVRTRNSDISVSLEHAVILPEIWDRAKNRPRDFNRERQKEQHARSAELSDYLDKLRDEIIVAAENCDEKGMAFTRELLSAITGKKAERPAEIPRSIGGYADWLIEQMKAGAFKHGSENYDGNTIKVWRSFGNIYKSFEKEFERTEGRVLVWSGIDKQVLDAFIKYLDDRGYLTKTINKHIITFKALVKYASVYHHLHKNMECLNYIQRKKEREGCTTTKTYLNDAEVDALYNMQLEPGSLNDKVRDIFLIGVYTCQRVSDYNNLSRSNFGETSNGTRVIRLTQEKTNNTIVVPILNDNLQKIVEKYDYRIPRVSDVIINRYIKDICKKLSKDVPSLDEPIRTILTLRERRAEKEGRMEFERDDEGNVVKRKYDCITTHTARRSGITNMYKMQLYTTRQMMSISGHKTETSFFLYISESSDELADEIAAIREKANRQQNTNEDLF